METIKEKGRFVGAVCGALIKVTLDCACIGATAVVLVKQIQRFIEKE